MAYVPQNPRGNGWQSAKRFIHRNFGTDETYIGGKPCKSKDTDNKPKKRRGAKKTPVVGIADRDSKKVHADVSHPNKNNQKLTGKQLLTILEKVANDNLIITDEFKSYRILDKDLRLFYEIINHSYEYSSGDIHTNSIESFGQF